MIHLKPLVRKKKKGYAVHSARHPVLIRLFVMAIVISTQYHKKQLSNAKKSSAEKVALQLKAMQREEAEEMERSRETVTQAFGNLKKRLITVPWTKHVSIYIIMSVGLMILLHVLISWLISPGPMMPLKMDGDSPTMDIPYDCSPPMSNASSSRVNLPPAWIPNVDDIFQYSCTFPSTKVLVITGAPASGKTTLMNTLMSTWISSNRTIISLNLAGSFGNFITHVEGWIIRDLCHGLKHHSLPLPRWCYSYRSLITIPTINESPLVTITNVLVTYARAYPQLGPIIILSHLEQYLDRQSDNDKNILISQLREVLNRRQMIPIIIEIQNSMTLFPYQLEQQSSSLSSSASLPLPLSLLQLYSMPRPDNDDVLALLQRFQLGVHEAESIIQVCVCVCVCMCVYV